MSERMTDLERAREILAGYPLETAQHVIAEAIAAARRESVEAALRAALPAEPTHEAMATLVQTLEATASRECPGAVAEILYRALRAHLLGEDA